MKSADDAMQELNLKYHHSEIEGFKTTLEQTRALQDTHPSSPNYNTKFKQLFLLIIQLYHHQDWMRKNLSTETTEPKEQIMNLIKNATDLFVLNISKRARIIDTILDPLQKQNDIIVLLDHVIHLENNLRVFVKENIADNNVDKITDTRKAIQTNLAKSIFANLNQEYDSIKKTMAEAEDEEKVDLYNKFLEKVIFEEKYLTENGIDVPHEMQVLKESVQKELIALHEENYKDFEAAFKLVQKPGMRIEKAQTLFNNLNEYNKKLVNAPREISDKFSILMVNIANFIDNKTKKDAEEEFKKIDRNLQVITEKIAGGDKNIDINLFSNIEQELGELEKLIKPLRSAKPKDGSINKLYIEIYLAQIQNEINKYEIYDTPESVLEILNKLSAVFKIITKEAVFIGISNAEEKLYREKLQQYKDKAQQYIDKETRISKNRQEEFVKILKDTLSKFQEQIVGLTEEHRDLSDTPKDHKLFIQKLEDRVGKIISFEKTILDPSITFIKNDIPAMSLSLKEILLNANDLQKNFKFTIEMLSKQGKYSKEEKAAFYEIQKNLRNKLYQAYGIIMKPIHEDKMSKFRARIEEIRKRAIPIEEDINLLNKLIEELTQYSSNDLKKTLNNSTQVAKYKKEANSLKISIQKHHISLLQHFHNEKIKNLKKEIESSYKTQLDLFAELYKPPKTEGQVKLIQGKIQAAIKSFDAIINKMFDYKNTLINATAKDGFSTFSVKKELIQEVDNLIKKELERVNPDKLELFNDEFEALKEFFQNSNLWQPTIGYVKTSFDRNAVSKNIRDLEVGIQELMNKMLRHHEELKKYEVKDEILADSRTKIRDMAIKIHQLKMKVYARELDMIGAIKNNERSSVLETWKKKGDHLITEIKRHQKLIKKLTNQDDHLTIEVKGIKKLTNQEALVEESEKLLDAAHSLMGQPIPWKRRFKSYWESIKAAFNVIFFIEPKSKEATKTTPITTETGQVNQSEEFASVTARKTAFQERTLSSSSGNHRYFSITGAYPPPHLKHNKVEVDHISQATFEALNLSHIIPQLSKDEQADFEKHATYQKSTSGNAADLIWSKENAQPEKVHIEKTENALVFSGSATSEELTSAAINAAIELEIAKAVSENQDKKRGAEDREIEENTRIELYSSIVIKECPDAKTLAQLIFDLAPEHQSQRHDERYMPQLSKQVFNMADKAINENDETLSTREKKYLEECLSAHKNGFGYHRT